MKNSLTILTLAALTFSAQLQAKGPKQESFSAVDSDAGNTPALDQADDDSQPQSETVSQDVPQAQASDAPASTPTPQETKLKEQVATGKTKNRKSKAVNVAQSSPNSEISPIKQRLEQVEKELRTLQAHSSVNPSSNSTNPTDAAGYEPVPADQAGPVTKRLKLIETLIMKYGRAYDYRTHTTKDLEMILRKLEAVQDTSPTT